MVVFPGREIQLWPIEHIDSIRSEQIQAFEKDRRIRWSPCLKAWHGNDSLFQVDVLT
jgi:hypothetical protein